MIHWAKGDFWRLGGHGPPKSATEKGPRLLWRTNRKSHMRFRLVPKSKTFDDLEQLKRHSCRNRKVLRSPPEICGKMWAYYSSF